ncbi:MAG: rod shape-determining protein MreC [Planctomycetes bacterium]|nr:rod shape-determining protein MreC [Planctomycetota bacterium]MCB9934312.1 rod shape-determining protein MreC [Planctomycetota bacterium]
MRGSQEKLSLAWFLRHPLVATCILLALTIVLPYLRVGERLKLLTFLPLARAQGQVGGSAYEELSEDERVRFDLQRERDRNSSLASENARLARALLDLKALGGPDFAASQLPPAINAQVVFHGDSSNWRHSCWINRGRKQGVSDGMPVVAGRTLIGRIFMVGDDHACVQLLTDPGFACSCLIVDPDNPQQDPESRVRGVLRGDGSAMPHFPRLELEDVAVGAEVKPGMYVITNDYSGQFPLGLAVGVVREAIPQAGFLQVRIEANMDLATLEVVQVLQHRRPELEQQALQLMRKK